MFWIKNTSGKPDAMLTFAVFSFMVVTANILLSTFGSITIGDNTINLQVLDSSIMAVYLGATFTAYVSRRLTDKVYTSDPAVSPVELSEKKTKKDELKSEIKEELKLESLPTASVECFGEEFDETNEEDDDDIILGEPVQPDDEPTEEH